MQIVCMQGVFSFSMLSQHGQHHSMQTRMVSTWHRADMPYPSPIATSEVTMQLLPPVA